MIPTASTILRFSVISLALIFSTGCSVLVGNVRPVDEKSESYGVLDLTKSNPDWSKLDPEMTSGAAASDIEPTDVSDVAYQSKKTASIISLNSACRKTPDGAPHDLKKLTDLLLLGITNITLREEKGVEVMSTPALETTIEGRLNREQVMLRTVVLRRSDCVYDMVYMARPQVFPEHEADFAQFVASLRVR